MRLTKNGLAITALAGVMFAPAVQAQIEHVEMRVEGMT